MVFNNKIAFKVLLFLLSVSILSACYKPKSKTSTAAECLFVHTYYPLYNDTTVELISILDDSFYVYRKGNEYLYEDIWEKIWYMNKIEPSNDTQTLSAFFYFTKDSAYGYFSGPYKIIKNGIYKSDSTVRSFGTLEGPVESDSVFTIKDSLNRDSSFLRRVVTTGSKYLKGQKDTIIYFYSRTMNDAFHNMARNERLNFNSGLKLYRMEMNFFMPEHPVKKTRGKFKGFAEMRKVNPPRPVNQIDSLFFEMKKAFHKART